MRKIDSDPKNVKESNASNSFHGRKLSSKVTQSRRLMGQRVYAVVDFAVMGLNRSSGSKKAVEYV